METEKEENSVVAIGIVFKSIKKKMNRVYNIVYGI